MSELGGILSLFFIAAALITSWYAEPPRQMSGIVLPTLQISDQ